MSPPHTSLAGLQAVSCSHGDYADLASGVPDWLTCKAASLAAGNDAVLVMRHWSPNMTRPLPKHPPGRPHPHPGWHDRSPGPPATSSAAARACAAFGTSMHDQNGRLVTRPGPGLRAHGSPGTLA